MVKKNLLNCLILVAFFGCANTYKLENKSTLSFTESYYNVWTSGVKGGGSGFNIYLMTDKNLNNIKIQGIYFKEKYTKIKNHGANKYQAFIKGDNNSEGLVSESFQKVKTDKTKKEKIPFILKNNEAVISYLVNEKQKYTKIIVTKKETKRFSM